tara:strand:- start:72 stop:401 length:330 start_codon:yes stop_codon:yes gene_type:complete
MRQRNGAQTTPCVCEKIPPTKQVISYCHRFPSLLNKHELIQVQQYPTHVHKTLLLRDLDQHAHLTRPEWPAQCPLCGDFNLPLNRGHFPARQVSEKLGLSGNKRTIQQA